MGRDEKKPRKKATAKPKKAARTEMCVHRRKPDEYCSRCDGGG